MKRRSLRLTAWLAMLLLVFTGAAGGDAAEEYYKRTIETYQVPDVVLLDQNGTEVKLKQFLDSDRPVMLDFIFATCTTICPVLSAGFAHFQKELGENSEAVHLVSITIDPDNDTPEIMKQYLSRYRGRPGWDVLTGKREDIFTVLKEFDAYVSNKMDHFPLTILRAPGSSEWVRIYGMLSAADLKHEYRKLAEE